MQGMTNAQIGEVCVLQLKTRSHNARRFRCCTIVTILTINPFQSLQWPDETETSSCNSAHGTEKSAAGVSNRDDQLAAAQGRLHILSERCLFARDRLFHYRLAKIC
jgi:hypothetical protein